jgi:hypothetical protein
MFTCEYFFSDVPNVVVIVTDGESNIENTQTLPEARLLQNTGFNFKNFKLSKTCSRSTRCL